LARHAPDDPADEPLSRPVAQNRRLRRLRRHLPLRFVSKVGPVINAVGNPQSLFVLGGTSDIALATAQKYAEQRPLRIVLADRPEESERMAAAVERLRKTGSTVSTLTFDARKPETH